MSKPSKLLKVVSIIVIILGSLSVLGGIFTTVMAVTTVSYTHLDVYKRQVYIGQSTASLCIHRQN